MLLYALLYIELTLASLSWRLRWVDAHATHLICRSSGCSHYKLTCNIIKKIFPGRDSNLQPLDCKSNALTTVPLRHHCQVRLGLTVLTKEPIIANAARCDKRSEWVTKSVYRRASVIWFTEQLCCYNINCVIFLSIRLRGRGVVCLACDPVLALGQRFDSHSWHSLCCNPLG